MTLSRGLRILTLLGVFILISLGFQPWPITSAVSAQLERFGQANGWKMTVRQASWVPWRSLRLEDVQLTAPAGGRLHLVSLQATPRFAPLLSGSMGVRCDLGEIRMDPASWRIRRPLAQELLSAGPVTQRGWAMVRLAPGQVMVDRLSLDGPLLRAEAQGVVGPGPQGNVFLQGALSRTLLRGLHLGESDPAQVVPWEPFEFKLEGAWERPQIRFNSHFVQFVMNPEEGKP